MRLTRFTDNALRCLIYLAAAPTRTATVYEVATRMRMSPDHLLKVIRRLVQLRYVRTIRGRRGGVQLAKSAASITVAEIVRSTEDNLTLVPCFEPGFSECPIAESCLLAPAMAESLSAFFAVLERHTIADIAAAAYAVPAAQPVHGGGLVPVDLEMMPCDDRHQHEPRFRSRPQRGRSCLG